MKTINRAGIIPYVYRDGILRAMFMKPSDPKYGGDKFQIAKGKVEDGEFTEETAIREGYEELGLLRSNIKNINFLGTFLGYTDMFYCEVYDTKKFDEPGFETGEAKWLTVEEFYMIGRHIHFETIRNFERTVRNSSPVT